MIASTLTTRSQFYRGGDFERQKPRERFKLRVLASGVREYSIADQFEDRVGMVASDTLSLQTLVNSAKQQLHSILNESGTILYSSCATLKRGKYYFLGLNPGGVEANTKTIQDSLDSLGTLTRNAYLDEEWGIASRSYKEGEHPLQQNYRFLFKELLRIQEDPIEVCASNLIFSRSISEKDAGGRDKAELCWPVHEAILEIVRPTAIITFGRQPFNFIRDKLSGTVPEDSPSGHGKWAWRYSILKTGEKLIGLPHLSRYALRNHPDVVDRIRRHVG
jgi:hypothetical protein